MDANGAGTYLDVIRAINWVVANKDTHAIRVLNLSFSTTPRSYYWDDPLNKAVMAAAWEAGIVVIASAGNTGPDAQSIGVPGNVPYIITVGLNHIQGKVTPIAVRTLDKQARYRDYARAFLVQDESGNASIIVPAGQFKCGSMILCLDEEQFEPIQLKCLVRNTRAFTQYTFKRIDVDGEISDEIISSLKQLLYKEIN